MGRLPDRLHYGSIEKMSKLKKYNEKRDFRQTSEPSGGSGSTENGALFVIQEHAASTHHFDFRLQVDGVLRSWAVPKGPSTDPSEKRLAIATEDHPLDYADFEGVIPEDEYGGGEVIVWDQGTYEHLTEKDGEPITFEEAEKKGHIAVRLDGEKIAGGYDLIKMKGKKWSSDHWLLKKRDDDEADARRKPTSTEPESVLSGKTVDDLKEEASS